MKALLLIIGYLLGIVTPSTEVEQHMVKDPSLGEGESVVYVKTIDSITGQPVSCIISGMLFGPDMAVWTQEYGYKEVNYRGSDGSLTANICANIYGTKGLPVTYDVKPGYATYLTIPVDGIRSNIGSSGSSSASS